MNTDKTLQIESSSSADTLRIGEHLGKACRGNEVIVLSSDLGGGKTTMIKGIAVGIGVDESVGSPTFTLSRVYKGKKLTMHHFDFYRLTEAGVVAYELSESVDHPDAVTVIEWGDIVEEVLPLNRVIVKLERIQNSEDHRKITINYPEGMQYLVEGL